MPTKSTPEMSCSFTGVDMEHLQQDMQYTKSKSFRHAGEMIADGEGAFSASSSR